MLSGWLPDTLELPSNAQNAGSRMTSSGAALAPSAFDENAQWTRLSACFQRGAVLITLTTPANLSAVVEEKLKLIPGHAYAVLGFVELRGYRLIKIKNPWSRHSWAGLFSLQDATQANDGMLRELNFTSEEAEQGVFWMTWQDCVKFFANVHLSWNPYLLFPHPNGTARRPTRIASHANLAYHAAQTEMPQFHIRVAAAAAGPRRLHMVLSRHIRDSAEYAVNDPKKATGRGGEVSGDALRPFIALHIYDTTTVPSHLAQAAPVAGGPCAGGSKCTGRRVGVGELPDSLLVHRGVFHNTPHQTVSFTCGAGAREFTAVVSQHIAEGAAAVRTFSFSLSMHTAMPEGASGVAMHALPLHSLPAVFKQRGQWQKGQSCGGRVGGPTFGYNPQFALTLQRPSRIVARLSCNGAPSVLVSLARHSDDGPQSPSKKKNAPTLPWADRIFHFTTSATTHLLSAAAYMHNSAVVDSSLKGCINYSPDPVDDSQPAAALAGAPASLDGGAAAVALRGKLDFVLPKENNTRLSPAVGFSWPQFAAAPCGAWLLTMLLSQGRLVTRELTRLIVDGAALNYADPLARLSINAWALPAPTVIAVLNTEALQRSAEINKYENAAVELAKMAVALVATHAPTSDADFESFRLRAVRVDEGATQILLRLDAVPTPTDDMRTARKAVVEAVQLVAEFVDIAKRPTPAAAPMQSSAQPQGVAQPSLLSRNPMLPEGRYTIVASCWEKGMPGVFDLTVECEDDNAALSTIPQEGEGWSGSAAVQGAWPGDARPVTVELSVKGAAQFCCRALHMPLDGSKPDSVVVAVTLRDGGGAVIASKVPARDEACVALVDLKGGVKYRATLQVQQGVLGNFALRCFATADLTATVMAS
jgi:hypothetical protein